MTFGCLMIFQLLLLTQGQAKTVIGQIVNNESQPFPKVWVRAIQDTFSVKV
jgi:hypothetical protein